MEKRNFEVQSKLEKEMVLRLRHEWFGIVETIRWENPSLAAAMRIPSILIVEMKSLLGRWVPDLREIQIGRHLAMNGRWDSVCEVFRHEVAHQMADTFPGQRHQTSHGDIFKSCCRLIRANPRASGRYETLEERVWQEAVEGPDRILVKVKKLMSLAASKNRFEAASAAAKANALIARYNLDMIRNDTLRTFESIIITDPMVKRSQALTMAAAILSEFYFVESIWLPAYVVGRQRMGLALEITGTAPNLRIADYVFHYVLQFAESSWRRYKKENPACRSRSGYMTGVVTGFYEKLQLERAGRGTQTLGNQGTEKALLTVDDRQLIRHFKQRFPRVKNQSVTHCSTSASAYSSGKDRGRHLNIAKGITSKGGNSGRLIGE